MVTGRGRVQPGCGDGKRTTCILVPIKHLIPAIDYEVTREIARQRRVNKNDTLTQEVIKLLK